MRKYLRGLLPLIGLVLGILLMIGIIQYDLLAGFILGIIENLKSGK